MILPQDKQPGSDAEASAPGLSAQQQEEFVCLLNAAHGRLLRFVVSLVARRQDAEDILQRASVTMWRRFREFQLGTDFIAWATTIASYEVKNFHRVSGRSKVLFDEELTQTLANSRLHDLHYCDVRLDALEDCVQKLDEVSRGLIDAVYSRGEEIQDLARREGRAPQTFYNRLNVIRRMLTDCMRRKVTVPTP